MKKVTIRGATWYFEDINPENKEIILFVHGHPFDHTMWKYQHEALKDFRLLLPDLKGYGRSDYQFEKIFIEEQALDLVLLLDELEVEKVHLMGLSMGGQIIVEFQRLFPHRVKSLVICASLPNAETEESYCNRLKLAEKISQIGMPAYTQADIHKYVNLEVLGTDSPVYQHLFKMMAGTKKEGAVASHKGRAERRDNYQQLKLIHVPTLMIAGEKDYFFDVNKIKQAANQIKNVDFYVVANSGHLPNMEYVEELNELLLTFYEKLNNSST